MPLTTDAEITDLFRDIKTIALVGASPTPGRSSNAVMRYLIGLGYDVYPVNPMEKEILGRKSYASVSDIPVKIDMVDVFRKSEDAGVVVEEAIAVDARYVWLQLDIFADAEIARAEAAGIKCVVDKCPAIEMPRIGIGPENFFKGDRIRAREEGAAVAAAAQATSRMASTV